MNETQSIIKFWKLSREASQPVKKFALATVVRVQGSSYRRPGAKMLITEEGRVVGCVSGGCLERDLIRRAMDAIASQTPKLLRYDTRSDSEDDEAETYVKTVGLGCEGVIEIFLNPAPETQLKFLENSLRESATTSLSLPLPDGTEYVDVLKPIQKLMIFGAGHDAVPLVEIANLLGWQTTVVDCRSAFPTPRTFFAKADYFIKSEPDQAVNRVEVSEGTVVVTMTHNYEHDRMIIREILKKKQPIYLGMLGPKVRSERLVQSLEAEGVPLVRDHLYYPVGLDIGGNSPESIALSIAAEIQAVLSNRDGSHLKNRVGSIYSNQPR
jgi:xanthine/CO dehydrogenase XdhC/CoxF family maturation factor